MNHTFKKDNTHTLEVVLEHWDEDPTDFYLGHDIRLE